MTQAANHAVAPQEVLAYYGHHKCASSWIASVLSRIMDEVGIRYVGAYDMLSPLAPGQLTIEWEPTVPFDRAELRAQVDARGADFVTVGSADRQLAEILRPARAFHVIRDPRDLIVSGYFSHRNSHPTEGWPHLQAHRAALQAVSPEKGLLLEMEFAKVALLQIGDWDYTNDSVLELRMEELILYPYDAFLQIFRHLGLLSDVEPTRAAQQIPVWTSRLLNRLSKRRPFGGLKRKIPTTGEIVLSAVYARRFEAQTQGRERGVENTMSHYRKGVSGDWVNHFRPQHAEAFDSQFDGLLVRLGYEENSDWIARVHGPV
jgi:hypothetical protein